MKEETANQCPTVRQLRRRWKPHKDRLLAIMPDHPTPVRIHRACSWLAHVEQMDKGRDLDSSLISRWIAFNSLYGRWNVEVREPASDRDSWRRFLDRILDLDLDGCIGELLKEHKRLVMSLLDDEYLSSFFWQEPTGKRAGQSKKAKYDAQTWYIESRWHPILDRLMERIYLMRCQLVHGAATHGSRLNRTSLRRCSTMLGHLIPSILVVLIDHGADEDWGPMCYPPMDMISSRQPSQDTAAYGRRRPR